MKVSRVTLASVILVLCVQACMGQLNRGSFKKNVMSYISQVELNGFATRELLFDLESDFKNCEVTLEYFSRYHWDVPKGTTSLRTAIDVLGPDNKKLLTDTFQLNNTKNGGPIKQKLVFDTDGTYHVVIRNIEAEPLIGSLMLDMESCQHHDVHLTEENMQGVIHRIQKLIWRIAELFGVNAVSEGELEYDLLDAIKSYDALVAVSIAEAACLMMIAGWQIWMIKSILESKHII